MDPAFPCLEELRSSVERIKVFLIFSESEIIEGETRGVGSAEARRPVLSWSEKQIQDKWA